MDVSTMVISGEESARKARIYRDIPQARRTEEDSLLLTVYSAVGKGKRLLDVGRAFKETGLHDDGTPKLAISRACFEEVYFHPFRGFTTPGGGGFSPDPVWNRRATKMNFAVPHGIFGKHQVTQRVHRSPVPHIPPELRPRSALYGYHVLFEAEWKVYPVDPFLLKHVIGMLFTVEAEWELTAVEAQLLSAMHTT